MTEAEPRPDPAIVEALERLRGALDAAADDPAGDAELRRGIEAVADLFLLAPRRVET